MYLKSLRIKNLKLIEDLSLDFTRGGEVRRWTVLVGRNGRGKTAILQAIALAAAGEAHVTDLGRPLVASFPSRRGDDTAQQTTIDATFRLEPPPRRGRRHRPSRELPLWGAQGSDVIELFSRIETRANRGRFYSASEFLNVIASPPDPLSEARDAGLPYWFVAAYGVSRSLRFSESRPATPPTRTELQFERMRTLFHADAPLRAIGFTEMFDKKLARLFARFIQALIQKTETLLPELTGLELGGRGGVTRPEDLLDRDRVIQSLPGGTQLKLPATWLSHGYQSSLAWLSDLLGHALIEDDAFHKASKASPEELQGLVLIDELDLHLHPSWQRAFIDALKDTFPNLQFIATTHSPLLISALRPDEVIALELDERDRVVQRAFTADPRLLTGSELYEEFFGATSLYAQELGQLLDDYRFWAANPYRDDDRDRYVLALQRGLTEKGVALPFPPVARRPPERSA